MVQIYSIHGCEDTIPSIGCKWTLHSHLWSSMLIKEFGHQRQISLCYIRPLSFVQDVFASKYLLEAKNCIDKNVRIHLDIVGPNSKRKPNLKRKPELLPIKDHLLVVECYASKGDFHYKIYGKIHELDYDSSLVSGIATRSLNSKQNKYTTHYTPHYHPNLHRHSHHPRNCRFHASTPDCAPRSLHKRVQCVARVPEPSLRSGCDVHPL